jgi:membrane associated rhomboid family serine protease
MAPGQSRGQIPLHSRLVQHAVILGGLLLCLWLVEIADRLFWHGRLDGLGIYPRSWRGLGQIWISPFLHYGFGHLFANSIPLLVLGWLVMVRSLPEFVIVSLVAVLVSGLGIWLFGQSNTVHIGASGVIFGYLGFLLLRGYFEHSAAAVFLALAAGFLYGGMMWGVLPGQPGISWLGHLFGFVGGGLAAYLLADRDR